MKRALKKRVKAVLNNTPNSEGVPVVQLNETNHKPNRRAGTQAAMIGLAISMGATSLLVTRQSDQAQAAAPVGSQKAASSIPAVSDTEIKFTATKLESQAVSSASVPENPVIVEPTAVSQVPGLEAKWPVAAKEMAVQISAPEAEKSAIYLQPQAGQGLNSNSVQSRLQADKYLPETGQKLARSQGLAESQPTEVNVETDVNAQLKAQQEFALNRLQQKSNRLRNSLAELRSEETQKLSQTGIEIAQPTTVADNTLAVQSEKLRDANQTSLISKLKQEKQTSEAVQKEIKPALATPKVIAQLPLKTYEVKPGDTLAEIANNYGTSVSELVKANNLQDPNQLQISQQLIIPGDRAGRSSFNQVTATVPIVPTLPTRPTFVPSGSSNTVANYPLSKPNLEANLPQVSQSLVVGNNNNVSIPIPVVKENQLQVKAPATISSVTIPVPVAEENQLQNPATDLKANSDGIGGETPLPYRVAEARTAQKQPQKVANKAKGNERLRSLQAEIERLREKYRAQESGIVINTVADNGNAGIPIPLENANEFKPSNVNSQLNAVAIPVPKPMLPSYNSGRPVQPSLRATRVTNEPVNPEFIRNRTASAGNSARNSSGIRLVVPPAGATNTDSLGKLRGTTVSPALPPLAAVDIYLPRSVDQDSNSSSTAYIWPAKGVLTSGYGQRWGRMHRGIDIANSTGTPIYASAAGVVEKAGWNNGGYGILVEIRHHDGSMTRYAHNSRLLVQVGQQVEQGQTIAAMGSTGFSTGPHTHFEVHPAGKGAVNPIAFMPPKSRL